MKIKMKMPVLFAAVALVLLYMSGVLGSRISFGITTTNTSKEWKGSFVLLQGTIKGFLEPEQDSSMIVVSSSLERGEALFSIYDSEDNLIESVESGGGSDTIRNIRNSGIYRVEMKAKMAKGSFDISVAK